MTAWSEGTAMMSDAEHERPTMQEPCRGSIVKYRVDGRPGSVASGVVTGPIECDPSTDQFWVGIRKLRDDQRIRAELITMASIVEVLPPPHRWDTGGR